MLPSVHPAIGIFMKRSALLFIVRVTGGSFTICFVLYLHSLSTYDIVITTYSLLAKEIPTEKQEGLVPATDLSEEVRLGAAREGEVEQSALCLRCYSRPPPQ